MSDFRFEHKALGDGWAELRFVVRRNPEPNFSLTGAEALQRILDFSIAMAYVAVRELGDAKLAEQIKAAGDMLEVWRPD